MCIRDDWLVDISPLVEASANYKQMLDADCFTQTTFPACNRLHSVGKELQAVAPQAECLTKIVAQYF